MTIVLDYLRQLELEYPANLWSLLVPASILLLAVLGKRKCRLATGLRVLAAMLLVLAFAGLSHRGPTPLRHVVFVQDASASIGPTSREAAAKFVRDAAAMHGDHGTAFLSFGGEPGESAPAVTLDSDPAAAIRLAAASMPPDRVPQIVLLTDGNQTRGDLLTTAKRSRVPISVVPLPPFAEPEACLAAFDAPAHAQPGQSLTLSVAVTANRESTGKIQIRTGDELVAEQTVKLVAGANSYVFPVRMPAGETTFLAELSGFDDTRPENNRRFAAVTPVAPPRMLVVGGPANLPRTIGQQGVTVSAANELPGDYAGLDAVAVVDPGPLPKPQVAALEQFVRDGGGLIVIGGEKTFSKTAYSGSELERLLPVRASETVQEKTRVLALVMVIDRSKSMEEENRIGLAKQAAKRTVNTLAATDKCGVIAFGDDSQWISEIVTCANKPDLLRKIDTLQAIGLTNMYPALEKAFLALELTEADRRHVIVLSDGVPYPNDFEKLVKTMAAARITISTVSVGKGADQTLLRDIANAASGRHRHCDDPRDVLEILEKETKQATQPPQAVEFRPSVLRQLPQIQLSGMPSLVRYATTVPKAKAESLLVTPGDADPLLSWWRYGAGTVVACTADITQNWANWPSYGSFWGQLARHTVRGADSDAHVTTSVSGGRLTIELDAVASETAFWNHANAQVEITPPNSPAVREPLVETAPGRYAATIPAAFQGVYRLQVAAVDASGRRRQEMRLVAVNYPDELQLVPLNERLLRDVAAVSGGQYAPESASLFAADQRTAERITPLWPILVVAAIVVFLLELAWRRWSSSVSPSPSQLAAAMAQIV